MKLGSTAFRFLIVSALLAFAGPYAFAEDEPYNFEMLIFERPGYGDGEYWPELPGEPDQSLAVDNMEGPDALPGGPKTLGPVAYTLRQKGMVVHKHLSWRQTPGRRNSETWRWLDGARLNGLIRVTRGRFLHLDTDLLLKDQDSPEIYRVQLSRRMRSEELHYVDHPKLGVIIRAERYVSPEESPEVEADDGDAASGEPKPAKPLATPKPS